ncbi:MAG: hypothetical protein ACYTG1_02720 [Planctomycetota bacterium]|jgi:hypothetical protein
MAKMFYTLEEVCLKLGKSEDEVKEMAGSGQIQEFRDRDKLMFKVDQIDLLAGGDEDTSEVHLELEDTSGGTGIPLSESGSGLDFQDDSVLGLADSREDTGLKEGSVLGLADSREGTGISIFDTSHGSQAPAEATQVGDEVPDDDEELSLESVGSGSGLLDLTRESDDTSLGAELLEEVYSGDENIEIPGSASGLFEAAATESPGEDLAQAAGPVAVPVMVEAYDGAGSGLGIGMLIGALAALVCVAVISIVGVTGATPALAKQFASSDNSIWIWTGGLLGGTIIFGLVGLFIGKASE